MLVLNEWQKSRRKIKGTKTPKGIRKPLISGVFTNHLRGFIVPARAKNLSNAPSIVLIRLVPHPDKAA